MAQVIGEEVGKEAGDVVGRAYDVLDEVVASKWVADPLSQRIEEVHASLARARSASV